MVETDVWRSLAASREPIVLYGTGNGADKILAAFERFGIKAAGVFASEGFVRDRSFRGMRVLSLAEAEARFGDFTAAVAFASSRREVLDSIYALAGRHRTLLPDVPAVGEELFDLDFYKANREKLEEARSLLCDEVSVSVFDNVVQYKLTGELLPLRASATGREALWEFLRPAEYKTACDLGAYRGDTVAELISRGFRGEVCAFEPDPRSFKKLEAYCRSAGVPARLFCAGAWSEKGSAPFEARGGRSSLIGAGTKAKTVETPLLTLDGALGLRRADYIKYDVEGAEREALLGSAETIKRYSPDLRVAVYHRSRDLFELPLLIRSINPGYALYLRRAECVPAWDLDLIAAGDGERGNKIIY